jgi:hypothetical protein
MTFEEMVIKVQDLSISERKTLINVIVDSLATAPTPQPKKKRIFNMHAGLVWMSDDFDDELPDSFWFGDDE